MKWIILFSLAGILVLGAAGFGGWILTLPPSVAPAPVAVPAAETAALIDGLRPPKRGRPVVAVIGLNDATETLDYIMSTGILRRADVADVVLVATQEGPVKLYPVLQVEPDMTTAQFDADHPDGADYVIVPAMSRDDDPAVMAWLKAQAHTGSMIIGVCAGAKVVAAAGLLEHRRGTTHWFYKRDLLQRDPTITPVADRRFVVDGPVATTTGISAAIPFALTLIEAIAGHEKAQSTAASLGIAQWDARHDSSAFGLKREFVTTVMANSAAFWQRETLAIPLKPGFDAVSLALAADAWSRTYRSQAVTLAQSASPVVDFTGIRLVPDRSGPAPADASSVEVPAGLAPGAVLDNTLAAIGQRYGEATEKVVAMQLEYDGPGSTSRGQALRSRTHRPSHAPTSARACPHGFIAGHAPLAGNRPDIVTFGGAVETWIQGVDDMKRLIFIAGLAAAAACSSPAFAGDGTGNNGQGNGNKTLTLVDGDTFSNPGQMFQYLRIRTDAAAGNPKQIVDAYPASFANVGDLIQQKRDATEAAATTSEPAGAPEQTSASETAAAQP